MENPKYTYGDRVKFKIQDRVETGVIEIVDARGTFEQNDEPSYDIFIEKQNCLYKHILQSSVLEKVGESKRVNRTAPKSSENVGPSLNHWHLSKLDNGLYIAHGVVNGHEKLMDSTPIRTSPITNVDLQEELGLVTINTMNTKYNCWIKDCDFSREATFEYIPELVAYKDVDFGLHEYQSEDSSILLVFSNREEYYYECAYIFDGGEKEKLDFSVHIGTFQDSCLIRRDFKKISGGDQRTDIRYFPHFEHIQFYSFFTGDYKLFFENSGRRMICFTTPLGLIKLNPGERKAIVEENCEESDEILDRSDLYPAVFTTEEF